MKKKLMIFTFLLLACICLSCVANAQEQATAEEDDVSEYIQEKIAPVVAGVLTSVVALVTTLGSISKSLTSLKDTKSSFTAEAKERAESFNLSTEMLKAQAKEIKEMIGCVPELEGQLLQLKSEVENLICQSTTLAEILTLGFSANSEIIKSGRGEVMSTLLENAKCKAQSLQAVSKAEVAANETA